jgi:hypothetical protein
MSKTNSCYETVDQKVTYGGTQFSESGANVPVGELQQVEAIRRK